jgi:hypothetical protein
MSTADLPSIYTVVVDALVGAAALGGVIVARDGLQAWKAQLRGTVEYELTRRLLRATYKYRDGFSIVRNPVMFGSEHPSLPEGFSGSGDDERFHGLAGAYSKRWDRFMEARRELDAELLEAEVIWDSAIRKLYEPLFGLQGELIATLNTYLTACNPRESAASKEACNRILRERRDSLYETNFEADTFSLDVTKCIADLENTLKPHLRR